MIKKLILLTSIIAIVTIACNKENAPMPDNTVAIESEDSSIELIGGEFGPTLSPPVDLCAHCAENSDLGDCKGVLNSDSLNIATDSKGTGFYNIKIGETTSFDLWFDSNSDFSNIVEVRLKVDSFDHPISVEATDVQTGKSPPQPSVTLQLQLNKPRRLELTILSTDGFCVYERELIDFNLTLVQEVDQNQLDNNNFSPSSNETPVCLNFDFGDEYCGEEGTGSQGVILP